MRVDLVAVSDAIPLFLRRVRAVLYRHEAGRAVLYAIAAIGGLAIVVPLLGHAFGASRASAMALLGIGGLATVLVLVGGVVMGLVVPRKKWSDDPDLANDAEFMALQKKIAEREAFEKVMGNTVSRRVPQTFRKLHPPYEKRTHPLNTSRNAGHNLSGVKSSMQIIPFGQTRK